MISGLSNNNHHGINENFTIKNNSNNSNNFIKPKNSRNFGSTYGRKIVTLPLNKKNHHPFQKGCHQSIFDHFIFEVGEKLMQRQLCKDKSMFLGSFKSKDEEESTSDLHDLLSWYN